MKKNNILIFLTKPIVLLLLIGALVRILFFFMYQPYNHLDNVIISDAKGYHLIALSLINTHNFIVQNTTIDTIRTPIYPLFLSFFYAVFGTNISAIIIVQQLLSLSSVLLLYKIGKKLFNKKVGLISAIILCFEPDHIYYSYSLLTDTLFVFLLLSATLFFISSLKEKKMKLLLISAFILGIATLTRPISLFIPILVLFIITIYSIKTKENIYYIIKKTTLFLIVFILAISPWFIRNKLLYDSLSLTAISGENLLNYNVAYTIKQESNKSIEEIRNDLYRNKVLKNGNITKLKDNRFYLSKIQTLVAIDYIKQNTWKYIKINIIGIFNLYTSIGYKAFTNRFFATKNIKKPHAAMFGKTFVKFERFYKQPFLYKLVALFYLLYLFSLYSLFLVGIFYLLKQKKYIIILFLLLIIIYFTILTGAVGLSRYKLPISPYYILFASIGFYYLFKKIKQ